jgi:hypothetical protein
MNAKIDRQITSGENACAASMGTNTRVFFSHWCGRNALM